MSDDAPRKRGTSKEPTSIFGILKPKAEKKVKTVTVREEKKKLRRVVKPMSRKHMSEALERPEISLKQIEITERMIEGVTRSEKPIEEPAHPAGFTCAQCGAFVPGDLHRCPNCNILFINDVTDEELEELADAEHSNEGELEEFSGDEGVPVIHFDAESGMIHYLEKEGGEKTELAFECGHCGTVVELNTSKCPICGAMLDEGDTGLVGLFSDMEFDTSPIPEADCPFCGEHVTLSNGMCPKCNELIYSQDPKDPAKKITPIVKGEHVVFLHLDVETGELNYIQKLHRKIGLEHMSMQLDGIGRSTFDQEWKGVSRV
jgi:rubrerythrin